MWTDSEPGSGCLLAAWVSLSVQSGWRQLWALRAPAGSVSCLEALRLLSTLWVVTLHKMIIEAQQPAANKTAAAKFVEDIVVTPIMNGISSVDTFLMISGFLRCRNMLKELDEGRFSYWRSLLQRLIRLVPAYVAVVAVYATLLERAGAGPLWRQTMGPQADWCRRHWYLNLLFLNNYVATEEICVAQSWYLSADMQLFVAAPLLVWPLHWWRRAGPALLAALLLLSVALPAATTLLLCDCPALIGLATSDDASLRYARYVYFPTHNRMAPYLVGIGLAYVMHRGYFTKINKTASLVCWAASLGTLGAVVLGPRRMLSASFRLESALPEVVAYAGLHSIKCFQISVANILGLYGTKWWIGTALEAPVLRPWSRLCYSVYLTHLAVLLVQQGSMRVAPALDKAAFVHGLVGDLAASALVSAALYLLLEAPCLGLGRALLRRLGRRPAAPRRPSQPATCVTAA
ncbi:O-acyltransferase like protein-like [Schistocerca nitens]|uniref:O-acyltransferase like protein-like n=1 Tax=Schistocerca nitens TaxID=7011 RepID=UPI002117FF74|nr:O-acyltransferase like protein-like [Schistocerca nitens]